MPTLASKLTHALRDELLRGDYRPGQPLRMNQLCERFQVSLSPLREALTRLATEGFVELHAQRGFKVAPVSLDNHLEITRLRLQLEATALAESIARGGDAWEIELLGAWHGLQLLDRRLAAGEAHDRDLWEVRHRALHMALIGACRMPILLQFCETLLDFSDRYRRLFLRTPFINNDAPAEHAGIVEAALARDAGRATELLARHVQHTADNITATLQGRQGAADPPAPDA